MSRKLQTIWLGTSPTMIAAVMGALWLVLLSVSGNAVWTHADRQFPCLDGMMAIILVNALYLLIGAGFGAKVTPRVKKELISASPGTAITVKWMIQKTSRNTRPPEETIENEPSRYFNNR